jgi:hypothetical protein
MGERQPVLFNRSAVEACEVALASSLAAVQRTAYGRRLSDLRETLAKLVVKHAAGGETDPFILRKQTIVSFFSSSAYLDERL